MAAPRPLAPVRTCVACRTERPKAALLRFVRRPGGDVTIDPTGRMPGRGAYLCADPACLRLALRRSALERALGVRLTPELRSRLDEGVPVVLQGGADGA
ncbi:MAG: RNase P modulator RnpM [Chloroflexota bacterium]